MGLIRMTKDKILDRRVSYWTDAQHRTHKQAVAEKLQISEAEAIRLAINIAYKLFCVEIE